MGAIIMFGIYLLLGAFVVKLGIDNSRTNLYIKEILKELREIKEQLKNQNSNKE